MKKRKNRIVRFIIVSGLSLSLALFLCNRKNLKYCIVCIIIGNTKKAKTLDLEQQGGGICL